MRSFLRVSFSSSEAGDVLSFLQIKYRSSHSNINDGQDVSSRQGTSRR